LLGISSSMEYNKIQLFDKKSLIKKRKEQRRSSTATIIIEEGRKNTKVTFEGIALTDIEMWNVDRKSMLVSINEESEEY